MKLLHIGKKGNVEKYTKWNDFRKNIEIIEATMDKSDTEILAIAKDVDFIIADAITTVSGYIIENMPNLKLIHSEGVAFNSFDIEAATERGVYVCNCKGMNSMAVAEQTILLIIGMLRNVRNGDIAVREGNQIKVKENYMIEGNLYEVADFNVGLFGFGDIAKSVSKILNVLGANVYYYDIYRAKEEIEKEYNVTYLPLDEMLSKCKIISLHIPVNPSTKNIVNSEFLNKMQDGSYIVNTARGELIDSQALIEAISKGKIAMAALDTLANEPVKKDNILITQSKEIEDKLLFSPHIGGITASSFKRGYEMIWSDIEKVAKGIKPENIVNKI